MRNNFKELNKRLDEREEEIERLNNIIKSEMYCKYADNCDEIYDCTKEEYNTMCESNMKLSLENTRLKNIVEMIELGEKETIDEWQELNLKYGDLNDIRVLTNAYWYGYLQSSEDTLERIKELKELKEIK